MCLGRLASEGGRKEGLLIVDAHLKELAMKGDKMKGAITGDFSSMAELRHYLYRRCQNRCKTRAAAKELVRS